ncbi:MAG TPA: WecB/TagA/CpsF family glycosyltransferase [Syntrophomonadaceae bacterium]|nr:WecB/TagA/CpsF family glycosyltransferase [Syntrophomonadaceae bacterium]
MDEYTARADILGCKVDLLNMDEVVALVQHMVEKREPRHIITLNAEIACIAQDNSQLREIINRADLVTPDGIGIVWAGNKLGYSLSERVTGIDLLYNLCRQGAVQGWGIYLLGAEPGVAEKAAARLSEQYPGLKICGTHHGYFAEEEIDAILEDIRQAAPDILFVALGAPRQEFFIQRYKESLQVPVCIGVGGSLDVVAGIKKRAPQWAIRLNIEWLYRLLSEPSRWKRQLVLPRFVWRVLRQRSS